MLMCIPERKKKECVGHERVKCYTDKGITIWRGNNDDSRWKYGATGVISVATNLVPGLMHSLMFEGENATLNEKLLRLGYYEGQSDGIDSVFSSFLF